jgi:hypothetical protein
MALLGTGAAQALALNGGYQLAFVIGAFFAATAGVLGGLFMRSGTLTGDATAPPH